MIDLFNHIITLFAKGGLVMVPLLACSILVVAITIERYLYFGKVQTDVESLLTAVDIKLKQSDRSEAEEICRRTKGIVAAMLAKGFSLPTEDRLQLEHTLEGYASLSVAKLKYRLHYLDTIVTLAPLLGLLGTVTGMIQSFSVLTIKAGQSLAITGGVGEALVATATGLCVAVIALVANSYFTHRLNAMITDIEQAANYLLSTSLWRDEYEIR